FWVCAGDGDGDVVEGHGDGGVGFVHGDGDAGHSPAFEHGVGDTFGEGFDEVDGVGFDLGDDVFGEFAVVDGVTQVVAAGCRGEVGGHGDGDDEVLPVAFFVVVDAVVPAPADAGDGDAVAVVLRGLGHRGASS